MKLAARTHQIFWDLHAWSGVVVALFAYVMFFMGAFGLFYPELDAWAEPTTGASQLISRPALGPLLEQLERERGITGADRVAFMPEPMGLRAYVSERGDYSEYRYAVERGRLEPVRSGLGSFLYSMHYLGPLPRGVWLAGFCAMAFFLAIASGLFIHARDLGRQLFQFRPERPSRTWLSDMHKALGVFGLPFQLLYAWTGAVLSLGYLVVQPVFLEAVFGGDASALAVARGEPPEADAEPTGKIATRLPDIDAWLRVAEQREPGMNPNWIAIEHVADAASIVILRGELEGSAFGSVEVVLRASDGALVNAQRPDEASAYQRFDAWFRGLHYARFGGYAIKLLYALLALATCAVIASGNLIWLERRDRKRAHVGNRILERLTTGVCAGVILATAAAFLGNRLLPADLPRRVAVEQGVFWAAWICALALPFALPFASRSALREPRRAAGLELLFSGALLSLVVLHELVTRTGTLDSALHRAVLVGLSTLGCAALLGGARLCRPRDRARARSTPQPEAPVSAE